MSRLTRHHERIIPQLEMIDIVVDDMLETSLGRSFNRSISSMPTNFRKHSRFNPCITHSAHSSNQAVHFFRSSSSGNDPSSIIHANAYITAIVLMFFGAPRPEVSS